MLTIPSQLLSEIMPMIYKRFTEKSAEEWRQIYKALQLLEFLVKNGSERVIDDARSHLTLLKMLRQFHHIDQNGKDQGINVRNRAKELTELLSDVERIRAERKKSRATRQKYTGVEGGAGLSMGGSSSSRYGGFGGESGGASADYGGYSGNRVFGDGGGFGGEPQMDYHGEGSSNRDRFDEYDEYDDGGAVHPTAGRRSAGHTSSSSTSRPRAGVERSTAPPRAKTAAPPKAKQPEVDLFSFDDAVLTSNAPAAMPPNTHAHNDDDDDFDDFVAAPSAAPSAAPTNAPLAALQSPVPPQLSTADSFTQFASPQPVSAPKQADLSSMMGVASVSPAPSSTSTPVNYSAFAGRPPSKAPAPTSGYAGAQPNYFTSVKAPVTSAPAVGAARSAAKPAQKPAAGGDVFGNLWQTASAGVKKSATPQQGPALGQLAKEKASAGIWGEGQPALAKAPAQAQGQQKQGNTGSGGLDDLLG